MSLLESGEGLAHLEVGDHGPELAIEPTKESEDQGLIPNWIAEVTEGCRHRFRQRQKSVMEADPCFAVRNSAESSRARDSRWPRNSFSRNVQAVRALGLRNIVDR